MTTFARLTPAGVGAIAVFAITGPTSWAVMCRLFSPAKSPLPARPVPGRRWYGRAVSDDVVLVCRADDQCELHCHGGLAIIERMERQFAMSGALPRPAPLRITPRTLLPTAPTLRIANILLDQDCGAWDSAIDRMLASLPSDAAGVQIQIDELLNWEPITKHLSMPWRVAIVGRPNVGKSSLVNALAGFERAIVSPIAGTTRDAVRTLLAFDGWPVELFDTAGIRPTADDLEAAGIAVAEDMAASADLVITVIDSIDDLASPAIAGMAVFNKSDLAAPDIVRPERMLAVSAKTGAGLPALIRAMVARLVPCEPPSGAAMPFSLECLASLNRARESISHGAIDAARTILAASRLRP
jgi:tRNA modification GTPase